MKVRLKEGVDGKDGHKDQKFRDAVTMVTAVLI